MTDPEKESLEGRIDTIEAELRKWRQIASVAIVLAVAAGALAIRSLRTPTEIALLSPEGARAVLRPAGLSFYDDKGRVVASLGGAAAAGHLGLAGGDGVSIEMKADKAASVSLAAADHRRASLGVSDHFSELAMAHGPEHVALQASGDLESSLSLGAANERGLVVVSSGGPKLSPRVQITTKGGDKSVVAEAGQDAASVRVTDVAAASRELTTR
jgi:hypothetical protein